ncbi:MAG: transposase [Planctomycetes bacterium]|nr:transposase [Planctomycetota bacterium]
MRYRCDHGTCNAHLLRELAFMDAVLHEPWARPLRRLLLSMLKAVRARGPEPLSRRRIEAFTRRYRALVAKGLRRHPRQDPLPGRRGRPRQSKAHNLLRRLHDHEISVLAFLQDPSVPFTNNLIERDLRMSKVQQKISGTFRTLAGARRFARIRAYISTARKNRWNILDVLSAALQHQPFMPRAPA